MADMAAGRDVVPAWFDQTLFPFKNRWIDIDGNRIHYVDEGNGPTLLLLHGNGSWSFLYRHIITRLAPHFRCIAFDHAGFGLSRARTGFSFKPRKHSAILEGFVQALNLKDIRLVVQDWGGPIGLGFAGRRPDLINKLIICNTWAWPAEGINHIENWSRLTGGGLGRLLIVRFNALTRFLVPMSTNRKLTRAEKAAYSKPYPTPASRFPHSQFAREILESRDSSLRLRLAYRACAKSPSSSFGETATVAFEMVSGIALRPSFPAPTFTSCAALNILCRRMPRPKSARPSSNSNPRPRFGVTAAMDRSNERNKAPENKPFGSFEEHPKAEVANIPLCRCC